MPPVVVNVVLLVTASLIYGSVFSLNKLAAEAGWQPMQFAFTQSLLAGLALAGVVVLRGQVPRPSLRLALACLVIGSLFVGLPITLLSHVAPHLPAAMTTLVLALAPVVTLVFAILLGIEAFRWQALAGIACGLAGIAILVAPGVVTGSDAATGWFLLALLAPLMFGLGNVLSSLLRPPVTASTAMAGGALLGSALGLVPLLAFYGLLYWPPLADGAITPALLASLVNAVFFVMLFEIIRRAGPTFFAQFNYLAVLAGVAWGAMLFGERPGVVFWLALALMLAGVYFATRAPARPAAAAKPGHLGTNV
jgi:drug/metabolite transporter (DMT)-like permease